jgi:hypothetical protein
MASLGQDGVNIGTVSGGTIFISPISVTKITEGSGGSNTGGIITTNSSSSTTNP